MPAQLCHGMALCVLRPHLGAAPVVCAGGALDFWLAAIHNQPYPVALAAARRDVCVVWVGTLLLRSSSQDLCKHLPQSWGIAGEVQLACWSLQTLDAW